MLCVLNKYVLLVFEVEIHFPRGLMGSELGEKQGDVTHSFNKYLLSIYFVPGTLRGCCRAFGEGEGLCLTTSSTF